MATDKIGSLIDGKEYWLGATYGTYNKLSHTFLTGNCFVRVGDTWFAKNCKDRRNPADYIKEV